MCVTYIYFNRESEKQIGKRTRRSKEEKRGNIQTDRQTESLSSKASQRERQKKKRKREKES